MGDMYDLDETYKIELRKVANGRHIVYTGRILDKDEQNLKIISVRGEEVIIARAEITRATRVTDSNEVLE